MPATFIEEMAVDFAAALAFTGLPIDKLDCLTASMAGLFGGVAAAAATGTNAVEFKLRLKRSQFVAVT